MKKNKSTRDIWIPISWRYTGAGYQKTKKKELPRKRKHKGRQNDGFYYVNLVYNQHLI